MGTGDGLDFARWARRRRRLHKGNNMILSSCVPRTKVVRTLPRATLGHVALQYGKPEEGPLAARLLGLFGFEKVQEIPLSDGTRFYHFVVDANATNNGDGILFLSPVPKQLRNITRVVREALKVGQWDEHPTVAALREGQANDPELLFHVAVLFHSLEAVEETILQLRGLNEHDPDFKGRLKIVLNAAMPGVAEIDARMAASPVFGGVTRYPYGRHGIQAFVETDLLSSGPLGENLVIELDYVFPGYPENLLTKTITERS